MDIENIKKLVDGYMQELMAEFVRYAQNMASAAEGLVDDMSMSRDSGEDPLSGDEALY